jgi:rubrerythrin
LNQKEEKENQNVKTKEMEQPQLNIDLSQTSEEVCESCENTTFTQVYKMRKLSALLSPMGQESMIPIQVFACAKCGHINKGFLPKED